MSTATPFIFPRSFPFCVTDIEGDVPPGTTYLDNLTPTQVMAFAWNLETITFTTAGGATLDPAQVVDGDSELTIEPMASDRFDTGSTGGDMWFGDALSSVGFGSWPSIRTPRERICAPAASAVNGALLDFGAAYASDPGTAQVLLGFYVGTDPVNSGKYRLYYEFAFDFSDPATETIQVSFRNRPGGGGMTAWQNGTITIGGLAFDWYSFYTTGATTSGAGTLSASSGSFTY